MIEAESSKIGQRIIPKALWTAMRAAPRIVIEADASERAAYLARSYADVLQDPASLAEKLLSLVPYHGRERVGAWTGMLQAGAYCDLAAELIARHYDPRYAKSRARGGGRVLAQLTADRLDSAGIAGTAAQVAELLSRA